jgi:ankyrin repeat protein
MCGWLMASCPYFCVSEWPPHGRAVSARTWGYVDAGDEYNETALYFVLANGHLGVARLLLDHGADPNIQDSRNCWYDRPSGGMS